MHPLFTIQNIRQENTYQNHRVWCDCLKGYSFPPNHRLSHSESIYHWPPPSLSHDALRFNLLLRAQWKLGMKVTLLLPIQKIDKDEGYSPCLGSISIFCDQNSLFLFQSFLEPREFPLSSLHFSPSIFVCPPHFLSFLPPQGCVWLKFPVHGQV